MIKTEIDVFILKDNKHITYKDEQAIDVTQLKLMLDDLGISYNMSDFKNKPITRFAIDLNSHYEDYIKSAKITRNTINPNSRVGDLKEYGLYDVIDLVRNIVNPDHLFLTSILGGMLYSEYGNLLKTRNTIEVCVDDEWTPLYINISKEE